jgi:hypothetical protein
MRPRHQAGIFSFVATLCAVAPAQGLAQNVDAPVAPVAAAAEQPVITLNQIRKLTLGGELTGSRQQEYVLQLEQDKPVIIDLIPVNPLQVRTGGMRPPSATGANAPPQATAPAILEVTHPAGTVVQRTSVRGSSLLTLLRPSTWEQRVGDSGVRVALYPTQSGVYRVRARYDSRGAAEFELLVRYRAVPAPAERVKIAVGSDKEFNLRPGARTAFEIRTEAPNQWVMVDMKSSAFDSNLEVHGPGGEDSPRLASDDDSGGGNDARILVQLVRPATYSIIARSSSPAGEGRYRLRVQPYNPAELRATPIAVGETVQRSFDGREEGYFVGDTSGTYHLFKLEGKRGQRIAIAMTSNAGEIDPVLQAGVPSIAADASATGQSDFAVIARNDDHEGGPPDEDMSSAKVRLLFQEDGPIFIRAGALDELAPRGEYTIRVTEEAASAP